MLLSEGYGYADSENRIPVDPKHTLVRAYSVSKPFTATAVMQLVEAGTLSLTEDVNTYLELFKMPQTFPQPITLAHLLTHTAGLDDDKSTLLARDKKRAMSLGEWLKHYRAPRARPVGEEVHYSNYGSSLAGYIVEVVSQKPYAEYMQQHILNPLGMVQSSFLWPDQLPEVDEAKVAQGYARAETGGPIRHLTPTEGDFANTPAANLLTTGNEIAHFMLANLDGGEYDGHRILSPVGIADMHEPWKSAANLKENVGYGFFWRPITNQSFSWLFHAGAADGSISDMELQPELNLGYFFWYNQGGDGDRKLREELNGAFAERFFTGCPG